MKKIEKSVLFPALCSTGLLQTLSYLVKLFFFKLFFHNLHLIPNMWGLCELFFFEKKYEISSTAVVPSVALECE